MNRFPSTVLFLGAALGTSTLARAQVVVFDIPYQMPAPINLPGSSSFSMALSADGLRAMVETDRAGGRGGHDLFLLRRSTTQSSFTSYGPMGFCADSDEGGGVWADTDLVLFHSNRSGGLGGYDLYAASGPGWGPSPIGLNSAWDETQPALTSDGLELFFTSNRPGSLGGQSIWRSTRATVNSAWGSPVALASIDSANHEQSPSITDDGLWLLFASNRGGSFDIYYAARSTRQAPFGAPVRVAELSGPNHDIGIESTSLDGSSKDTAMLVTVMINGRAVLLCAERRVAAAAAPGAALAASARVAVGEILSAALRSPAGYYGVVFLGMPMAPIELPIGRLELDPVALLLVAEGIQGEAGVCLAQILLPDDPLLRGLPIAVQALHGPLPELRLTNAIVRSVQ